MSFGIGTAQFGSKYGISNKVGAVPPLTVKAILKAARKENISLLDTAVNYGSEDLLGGVGVEGFKIVTKIPSVPAGVRNIDDWVERTFKASLESLAITKLHGLLFHNVNDLKGPHGSKILSKMKAFRDCGFVSKIGVSIYTPQDTYQIAKRFDLDLIQVPANLIDSRLEKAKKTTSQAENLEIHIRSVFLQGLLVMDQSYLPMKLLKYKSILDAIDRASEELNRSKEEICVRYVISRHPNTVPIIGLESIKQFHQLSEIFKKGPLPLDEVNYLALAIQQACGSFTDVGDLINPTLWSGS